MSIERHPVTDRASWLRMRERDATASTVGCFLGVHAYMTPFGLYALKSGAAVEDPEQTSAMERGELLEPVAAQLLRRRNPTWTIQYPVGEYYRDPVARLGCTPDIFAHDPQRGLGVIQSKSVEASIFRAKWRDPETKEISPPLWIAAQAITEAHLTGASWAAVAALVVGHGLDLHLVEVPIHAGLIKRIRAEVARFWGWVEAGTPPPADYARDGELLEQMFEPTGEVVDLSRDNMLPELLDERERLRGECKVTNARLDEIRAELLSKMKGASAASVADGRLITVKRITRKSYTVKEGSYLDLRVKSASNSEGIAA